MWKWCHVNELGLYYRHVRSMIRSRTIYCHSYLLSSWNLVTKAVYQRKYTISSSNSQNMGQFGFKEEVTWIIGMVPGHGLIRTG